MLVRRGKEIEEGVERVSQRGVRFQRRRARVGRDVDQLVRIRSAGTEQRLVVVSAEDGSMGDVERLRTREPTSLK